MLAERTICFNERLSTYERRGQDITIEKASTPQVGLEKDPSTTQVAVLIKAMNRDFMAIFDRMKVSDLKSRKRFRENYVTPALKDEAIERKYPNQPNHPKQQYRLTKKAQKWREKHT